MRTRRKKRNPHQLLEAKRKGKGKSQKAKNPAIKPKLKIGQPADKHEKEADQVADEVVSQPEGSVQEEDQKEE